MADGLTDISGLLQRLTGEYGETRAKREQRYQQGLGILQNLAARMEGPEWDKYAESLYESAKRKAVGAGTSKLISSGLMGTTRAFDPERAFEREVGTPFRLGLAEQKTGRVASALGRVADYMAGFPDIYPEPGTLAYMATGGFGQLTPEQRIGLESFPTRVRAMLAADAAERQRKAAAGGGTAGTGGSWNQMSGGGYSSGVGGYTTPTRPTYPSGGQTGQTTQTTQAGGQFPVSTGYGPMFVSEFDQPEGISPAQHYAQGGLTVGAEAMLAGLSDVGGQFAGGGGGQFGGTGATGGWGEVTPPATASLLSRYSRAKKAGFEGSYQDWYYSTRAAS